VNHQGLIRYVFASSHTSQGFYTFIPELISGLGKVYILKGAPGSGKATFIRMMGELMSEQGFAVEFWISAMDSVSPDGVYIPQLDLAIINGSLPLSIEPRYPGVRDLVINLDDYWDRDSIEKQCKEIVELVDQAERYRQQAYHQLKEAVRVKEEIRQINSLHLNMDKLVQLQKQLASAILDNQAGEKHYFAEAFTADGRVNYMHELSKACQKRYIFKGPAGSGKSLLINELAHEAKTKGYFLEYYHWGLEVDGLAMVIIRNLQIALIEAGSLEIPLKTWDQVIDLTLYLDTGSGLNLNEAVSVNYRNLESSLLEAQQELSQCQQSQRELKKIYSSAMDFSALDRIRQGLLAEIRKINP